MPLPVLVFALACVACAVAHIAIVASVLRSRSAAVAAGVPRPRLRIELLWALLPAVALAFVLTLTWPVVRAHARSNPTPVIEVAQ